MIKNIKWLFLVSITLIACNDDEEITTPVEVPVVAGSADFSKYVALGNSITAGFSDNALFKAGQENAFPNLMSKQFALVGGGDFEIPFMNDNIGGLLFGGSFNPRFAPRLVVGGLNPDNTPNIISLANAPFNQLPTTETFAHLTGVYNNMGVPGAKSFHLLAPNYGNPAGLASTPPTANPYFVRFASNPSTSILADAVAQAPTFFSLWIGNNDVLGYATSGGDGSDPITPVNGNPGVGFDGTYNYLIDNLTSNGAKGVVANIPYVTTIPFFKTVPHNPLTSSVLGQGDTQVGDATISALNSQLYGPIKQALTGLGHGDRIELLSTSKANPLLIKDETLTNLTPQLVAIFQAVPFNMPAQQAALFAASFGQARQANSSDLVLLTTRSAISAAPTATDSGLGFPPPSPLNKFGITFPLQDKHILIPSEISEIKTATDSYNLIIKTAASNKGLAFVDANAFMNQLANGGISFGTFHMTNSFVKGGAFSFDGVHLTPRANAFVANKFLEAINSKYGSTFRMYKPELFSMAYPAILPN